MTQDRDGNDVPLLEDFDGVPYPADVQRAHALAVGPWLAACDAVGVPHDPDALIAHHRGNAALAAVCAATADQLQAAHRQGSRRCRPGVHGAAGEAVGPGRPDDQVTRAWRRQRRRYEYYLDALSIRGANLRYPGYHATRRAFPHLAGVPDPRSRNARLRARRG